MADRVSTSGDLPPRAREPPRRGSVDRVTQAPHSEPCTPRHAVAVDGASLTAAAHGGHVLGWRPAGETRDRLWLSPLARCGPGEAIRGGVPVVFPQFAGRGPLPKHGLARDRAWSLETATAPDGAARVVARLVDDETTRAIWPHRFALTLTARALGADLDLHLVARNDGDVPFTATAALHAYLAVDAASAVVEGLGGLQAEDNGAGGAVRTLPPGALPARGPVDLAVRGSCGPVTVDDGRGGRLLVHGPAGVDSIVVWNPGEPHGLADVPPDGAQGFVCVEPARLDPAEVAPGTELTLHARLTALVPGS